MIDLPIELARLRCWLRENLTLPYVFGKEDPYICPSIELIARPGGAERAGCEMLTNATGPTNSILARSGEHFGASAEPITFRPGDAILRANQTTTHVFFPVSLVASYVRRLVDGSTIEAGIAGYEGVIGVGAMFGATAQASDVIVAVEGTAVRVPAPIASTVFDEQRAFRKLMLRFANAFTLQVGQSVACNWLHPLDRRLMRWFLTIADRIPGADRAGKIEIPVTQEFLASMLGARIAGINEAISTLTAAGLILHRRHMIEIIDRAALEAACCECYATVRLLYARDQVM